MTAMLVLTGPGLAGSDAMVERAVAALRPRAVGTPVRLGPEGVQIPVTDGPGAVALLRAALAGEAVDANWTPARDREKRILIADMDSTMIPVECIDEIAAHAGVGPQVAGITERAMAGELDFEGALRERVRLIAGLPEAALAEVLATRITLNPGARVLVRTMAARGAATALVSGGFTWFTERVAALAGFAEHRANTLIFRDGRLTGEVAEPILGREAKGRALTALCTRLGTGPEAAVALGDGANDLTMVEAAGLGVGYRPKPALAARADAVLMASDLSAVLHLQGIAATDFVTD